MITDKDVFFHEDDYSLIEIIPLQGKSYQSEAIDFFSSYSKESIPRLICNLEINLYVFENVMIKTSLKHIEKVYSGYSSERKLVNNCRCFCYENYAIFYEYNNNNTLNKIWLNYTFFDGSLNIYPVELEKALIELGRKFQLLLVDWNEMQIADLSNKEALLKYFITYLLI